MLQDRMKSLGVAETDLEETFIRSSGPGGQKVNKSSSCVYLRHLPTGLSVKCQKERSQSLNRFLARRLLLDKIEIQQKGLMAEARQTIEKIRRQKRKRSKRAKEKILTDKHQQAEKKILRAKVSVEE
ncbi:MAG TPA: peptide chain release factor-like protein [Smithella sp.]|nr:peptide chain release factor-like protein [Smithella sp.]HQL97356.1 peptide chain release factor-like protein [Smithella sp.]HQN69939.1 peptide chain release factor-like protein [Smithella sp.]